MTEREVESVAYPGPGSRPFRRDLDPIAPHVIVLFGCTGDLAKRKLLPGLAYLAESELAPATRIVGTAMEDIDTEAFRALARDAVQNYGMHRLAADAWDDFAARLTYVPQGAGPEGLTSAVKEAQAQLGDDARLLHYLSVPPKAAQAVVEMLRDADLTAGARVIMEKPFGHDFESAVRLNDFVHRVFDESQVFRIDHFLGKEAAQNILAFRFANGLFEPIWNRNFIDHVQIDIPEELGLDTRANFYEATGAYKDMVVTHLMQVMAFVAMEPPTALEPRAISEEKNKVFRSLLPIHPGDVVRLERQHRPEDLVLLLADGLGLQRGGRLHRGERQHLEEVRHDHVAEGAGGLVEGRALLEAECLRYVDLHVVDVVAVPDRLEQAVGEAEGQDVLRGLLAQEVVDAEDLLLVEHLVQLGVERHGRGEIGAERLLHDDPAALDQIGVAEHVHDRQCCLRRDAEVVQPAQLL